MTFLLFGLVGLLTIGFGSPLNQCHIKTYTKIQTDALHSGLDEQYACVKVSCNKKPDQGSAQRACEGNGAQLVSIRTDSGNYNVQKLCQKGGDKHCWIGLKQHANGSGFGWMDGSKYYYHNWDKGFPIKNANPDYSGVYMVAETGKWRNDPLESSSYVCRELEQKPTDLYGIFARQCDSKKKHKCPFLYALVSTCDTLECEDETHACYRASKQKEEEDNAEKQCKMAGDAKLASIHSGLENEAVRELCSKVGETCFLGAEKLGFEQWRWRDGTHYKNVGDFFDTNGQNTKKTVYISGKTGKWMNVCDDYYCERHFICKLPAELEEEN